MPLKYILGAGGGLLTKEAYDDMRAVGEEAQTEANTLAETLSPMSQFRPFTVTSTTGSNFGMGAQYDAEGNTIGSEVNMGLSPQEQAYQNLMMSQADYFGQMSGMDPQMREQALYERIRSLQTPEEDRSRLALEERMFNQGRLGMRTGMFGGSPEAFAMEKAQAEARNQASFAAITQAQQEALQQQQMGFASLGAAYLPQAQLMNVQQGSQLYPQMQQQAQMFNSGQYGETVMSGIEAKLIAEQKAADLMGAMGSSIINGLFS